MEVSRTAVKKHRDWDRKYGAADIPLDGLGDGDCRWAVEAAGEGADMRLVPLGALVCMDWMHEDLDKVMDSVLVLRLQVRVSNVESTSEH